MNRNTRRAKRQSRPQSLADFRRTKPELASGTCFVDNPRLLKHFDPVWLVGLSLPRSAVQALRAARQQGSVTMSVYSGKDSFAGDFPNHIFVTLSCPGHCVIAEVLPESGDVRYGIGGFSFLGFVPILLTAETNDDLEFFVADRHETNASLTRDELVRLDAVLRTHTRATGMRGLLTICEPGVRVEPDAATSN